MKFPFIEKRSLDANAAINMAAIQGIVGVALILSAGSIVLAGIETTPPDWIGNAVIGITGGLIGYLSRDPKQQSASGPMTLETTTGEGNEEVRVSASLGETTVVSSPEKGSESDQKEEREDEKGKT